MQVCLSHPQLLKQEYGMGAPCYYVLLSTLPPNTQGGAVSLVIKVSASRPESLDFEPRMGQREISLPKPKRIGAVKAFDPK